MAEPPRGDSPDFSVGRFLAATNDYYRAESRRGDDVIFRAERKRRLEEDGRLAEEQRRRRDAELEEIRRQEELEAKASAQGAPDPSSPVPADGASEVLAEEPSGGEAAGDGGGDARLEGFPDDPPDDLSDEPSDDLPDAPDEPSDDLPDAPSDDGPDDRPDGPFDEAPDGSPGDPADEVPEDFPDAEPEEVPDDDPDGSAPVEGDEDGAQGAPKAPQTGDGALLGQGEPPVIEEAPDEGEGAPSAETPGRVPRVAERFQEAERASSARSDAIYGIQPKDPVSSELRRTRLKEVPAGLLPAMRADIVSALPSHGEAAEEARALLSEMRYADVLVLWAYIHAGAPFADWMRSNGLLDDAVARVASAVPGEHRADGAADAVSADIARLARHVRALESDVKLIKVASALSAADAMGVMDVPRTNVTSFANVPLPLMGSIAQDSLLRLLDMAPQVLSAATRRAAGSAGRRGAAQSGGDV